jgi:hypothetical protein
VSLRWVWDTKSNDDPTLIVSPVDQAAVSTAVEPPVGFSYLVGLSQWRLNLGKRNEVFWAHSLLLHATNPSHELSGSKYPRCIGSHTQNIDQTRLLIASTMESAKTDWSLIRAEDSWLVRWLWWCYVLVKCQENGLVLQKCKKSKEESRPVHVIYKRWFYWRSLTAGGWLPLDSSLFLKQSRH